MKRATANSVKILDCSDQALQRSAIVERSARRAVHRIALFHSLCSGIVICGSGLPDGAASGQETRGFSPAAGAVRLLRFRAFGGETDMYGREKAWGESDRKRRLGYRRSASYTSRVT